MPDEEKARLEERAAIVAWLRQQAKALATLPKDARPSLRRVADSIESGRHHA